MNEKMISIVAPPAPRCFESRTIWVSYLVSAQQSASGGGRTSNSRRPFVDGQYVPDYPYCRDCSSQHAHAMTLAGRCDYRGYVKSLAPAAPATEAEGAPCSSST